MSLYSDRSHSMLLQLDDGTTIEVKTDNGIHNVDTFEQYVVDLLENYRYEQHHLRYVKTMHKG